MLYHGARGVVLCVYYAYARCSVDILDSILILRVAVFTDIPCALATRTEVLNRLILTFSALAFGECVLI